MALNGAPRRDRDEGDAFDGGAGHSGAVTPAKRARGGPGTTREYNIPGAVMKVKLHNFMTYSDVEMEPGPRLNVILGPNGTGKSSFVCALAIGLAGSTKLLGRADKISEFVKRGEQSGYSEITLATKNPNRPLVVRRDIKRKDGTSTWKVNGVTVPLERVKTEMRQLGVQLDNLCQFLPQDRVVEFARLTPEKLLQETEKAIGNAELYNLHAELIEEKSKIADLDRQVRGAARRPIQRFLAPPLADGDNFLTDLKPFLSFRPARPNRSRQRITNSKILRLRSSRCSATWRGSTSVRIF